ncbi:hypothetical protein A3K86_16270 [Photobacterium jeanii]|uniref:Uncharacterized protein n=1 Tax=Photobacterium jeanii TaxID=858640 RepID=A0A178K7E1_9GAMM|nr:hypothetical protein [Photobacterium jeanii]OAN13211.1 hypothetical protein A3K86_16270 [Photobacterium jeanii]PST89362.1 hypothetical protein C9I91_14705 [Photobacterium jeanii]
MKATITRSIRTCTPQGAQTQPANAISPQIAISSHTPMTHKFLLNELRALKNQLPQHCFASDNNYLANIIEMDFRSALNTVRAIAPELISNQTYFKIGICNDLCQDIPLKLTELKSESTTSNEVTLSISSHLLLSAICQRYQVQQLNPIEQTQYSIWLHQLIHLVITRQNQHTSSEHKYQQKRTLLEQSGQFDPTDEDSQQWSLNTVIANCYFEGIATLTQWLCEQDSPQVFGVHAAKRVFNQHVHPIQKIASHSLSSSTNIDWVIYENSDILYALALKVGAWMTLDFGCHHSDPIIRNIANALVERFKHEGRWVISLSDRNTLIHALIQQDIHHVVYKLKRLDYPDLRAI